MKNFLIAVLIFFSAGLCAQDRLLVQLIPYKHAIRLNPLRMAFREIGLGYEFPVRESIGLEIRPGYIYPSKFLDQYFVGAASSPNMKFKGVSLISQTRFYKAGKKENGLRNLNFSVGYRYLWYTDEYLWLGGFGGSSYANELYLSQWRNDLILMVGSGNARLSKKVLHEFEMNIGARFSLLHTKVNDCRFCHGVNVPPGSTVEEQAEKARDELNPADGFSGMLLVALTYHIGMVW